MLGFGVVVVGFRGCCCMMMMMMTMMGRVEFNSTLLLKGWWMGWDDVPSLLLRVIRVLEAKASSLPSHFASKGGVYIESSHGCVSLVSGSPTHHTHGAALYGMGRVLIPNNILPVLMWS